MKDDLFSQKTERFFPVGLVFGGIMMILIGTVVLVIESILGILILVVGVCIVFLHYGILIDFKENKYKEYWGLMGLKFGKWQNLPPISHISLTKSRYSQQIGLRAANTTLQGFLYRGNLRINERESILVIQSPRKEKVLGRLKQLAKKLNIGLLDCTEAERIWVE